MIPPFDPKNLKNIDPELVAKQLQDEEFMENVKKLSEWGNFYGTGEVKPPTDSPYYTLELYHETYQPPNIDDYDFFAPLLTIKDGGSGGCSWTDQPLTGEKLNELHRKFDTQTIERSLPDDFTENRWRVAECILESTDQYVEDLLAVAAKHGLLK